MRNILFDKNQRDFLLETQFATLLRYQCGATWIIQFVHFNGVVWQLFRFCDDEGTEKFWVQLLLTGGIFQEDKVARLKVLFSGLLVIVFFLFSLSTLDIFQNLGLHAFHYINELPLVR